MTSLVKATLSRFASEASLETCQPDSATWAFLDGMNIEEFFKQKQIVSQNYYILIFSFQVDIEVIKWDFFLVFFFSVIG